MLLSEEAEAAPPGPSVLTIIASPVLLSAEAVISAVLSIPASPGPLKSMTPSLPETEEAALEAVFVAVDADVPVLLPVRRALSLVRLTEPSIKLPFSMLCSPLRVCTFSL